MRYKCYLKAISLKEALELIENNRTVFYSYSANKPIWALTEGCLSAAIRNDAMFFTQDSMLLGERIMRKDIEWLKAEVEKQDIVMDKGYIYTSDLLYLIDKLDEPEVLSQEWIDENKKYTGVHDIGYYMPINKLYGKTVPKQELPVIPKYVGEWYESEGKCSSWWNWFYKWGREESRTELEIKTIRWMQDYNEKKFVDMFLHGYTVEEEQKYYVLDKHNRMMLVRMMDGKTITEADPFKLEDMYEAEKKSHRLTEKEIKDYDERYWPFAVEVEEVEK